MNEPDWENVTEEELWKYVAVNLKKNGIDTVLVGGSVVSIYSSGIFRSGDLDFVNINYQNQSAFNNILIELGFFKKDRHFIHPGCKHIFIEFVSPSRIIFPNMQSKDQTNRGQDFAGPG